MTYAERVVLLLALTPHLRPSFFQSIISGSSTRWRRFSGVRWLEGNNHRGLLSTAKPAQFVVAGMDVEARLGMQQIFDTHHSLYRHHALWLEDVREGEPPRAAPHPVSGLARPVAPGP